MMNNKPPIQVPSFVGSPTSPSSPSLCFPSPKRDKHHHHHHNNHQQAPGIGLCGCQRKPRSHCVAAIGVLILVLAYTAMGSILFMTLEGDDDDSKTMETAVAASKPYPRTDMVNADMRSKTVDRLWSITEDLNILYKENWTRLAAQEVQHFQDMLLRAVQKTRTYPIGVQPAVKAHKWSYASAFLYSVTLITTIGYGGISPRTQWGRIAALIYALFGIPIVLLYLSAMGEGLSSALRCIFRRIRITGGSGGHKTVPSENGSSTSSVDSRSNSIEKRPPNFHTKFNGGDGFGMTGSTTYHSPSVPISICIMILISYVTLGAVLFNKIQPWGVLESLYFCFTSLGTIGFGDLSPIGHIAQYTAAAYILIGMAVVAMCFSLIQTELIMWLRKFGVAHERQPSPIDDVALVTVVPATVSAKS